MWYVYLIQHDQTGQLYIGVTSSLTRRLQEHNKGKEIATRRLNGKWYIIYAEMFRGKEDALYRERKLKDHGRAKQELVKRLTHCLLDGDQKVVLGAAKDVKRLFTKNTGSC